MRNKKTEIRNITIAASLILSAMVAIVLGQIDPNQPGDNSVLLESGPTNTSEAEIVANDSVDAQDVQSINFRSDMSIRDALRFLAAKYRKNIIPSPGVNGKLSVASLYEVNFDQALDAILGNGFKYDVEDNFIKIYSAEEYGKMKEDKSRLTSKVFTLYYVNAAEVERLIKPLKSESGTIATTSAAAVDTEAGDGGDTLSMRDMISVYDFPERIEKMAEMIKQIDVRPPQVLIEVTILEAILTETTDFGINWTKIAGLTSSSTPLGIAANLSGTASTAFVANITNSQITAAITASEDVKDSTVLANPKIMALNKQAGYLNIGKETGYKQMTGDTASGTTMESVEFLESGTILKFRPYICDDGYIRMEINPELSETDNSDDTPDKTITTVKTNIMAKDGQTIVIAGLFKDKLINTTNQVPVVGDLPIIGGLFKNINDENIRTELVILITPHIINKPEDAEAQARKDDIDRVVHGSRKRLSPISRVRIYEDRYNKAVKLYEKGEYDKAMGHLDWIIAFRPNALEAVQLKEKILAETKPDEYEKLERRSLDKMSAELDDKWIRR